MAALAEVEARIAAGTYERLAPANDALAAARSALATVNSVSTWPWRPETLRGFVSALVVPWRSG